MHGGNLGVVTKLIKEAKTTIKDKSGSKFAADITAKLSSIESNLKGNRAI